MFKKRCAPRTNWQDAGEGSCTPIYDMFHVEGSMPSLDDRKSLFYWLNYANSLGEPQFTF